MLVSVLFSRHVNAQAFNFSLTPNIICFTGAGNYTAAAVVTATSPCASTYTWNFISPGTNTASVNYAPSVATGSAVLMTFTGCGIYTVNCFAYTGGIPCANTSQTFELVCPTAGTIVGTPTNPAICVGSSVNLAGQGGVSYSWTAISGTSTTNLGTGANVVVTPTANTTYSMNGVTAQGCNITASRSYSVQRVTYTVTPTAYTLCLGAPAIFNSVISIATGTTTTPGTATTGVQWFAPPAGSQFSSTPNVNTPAAGGTYSAILTHTGVAGTCTLLATAVVNTISTINVNAGPSSASVCPGGAVTLTAGLSPPSSTVASSYTWTPPTGPTFTGTPVIRNPTVATIYTVNMTYYGCTGSQTVSVGMATITPTISVSSPSTCPGRSLTITATGGITYTIGAIPNTGGNFILSTTASSIVHSPSSAQLPITYTVRANAAGCTGTAAVQVASLTLNTTLTANSNSVCPNTSVSLCVNNGSLTTWTVTSLSYSTTQTATNTGPCSTLSTFTTGPGNFFPLTFTVVTDSAGCRGSSSLVIYTLTLNPTITPSAYSICPGTSLTLSSSGGAGTNYTFTPSFGSTLTGANPTVNTVGVLNSLPASFPYSYTVDVDSAGCVGSSQIAIFELILNPTLTASSSSICPGSTFTLASTGGAGTNYTFTAPYVVSPSTVNTIPTSGPTDNQAVHAVPINPTLFPHTYTVQVDSAGCTGSSTVSVGLLNLATNLTLTASSASVCPNTTFTLTANGGGVGTTYSFVALPSTPVPTINLTQATTTSTIFPQVYEVTSDSLGCKGTRTVTVDRMYLNTLSLTATPTAVCAGLPTTLIATVPGLTNTAGYSYTFAALSPTGVISSGTSFSTVINPTVVTTVLVVADSAGCTTPTPPLASQIQTIQINGILTLTPSATSYSVCGGLSTTLSVAGPSNNITYTWSPAGSTSFGTLTPGPAPSASAVANPTTAVTYTIDGLDALGCIGSTVITIGIDPTASLVVTASSSDYTLCNMPNGPLHATLTASCNINPVTFSWSPSGNLNTNTGATVDVTSPPVTTVFSVVATNGFGCYGTTQTTITVTQQPSLSVIPNTQTVNICAGFTNTLTAFGATSYTWSVPGSSNTIAQQSIAVAPPTTTGVVLSYTLLGSNGGGCTNTAVRHVSLAPQLSITLQSSTTLTTCITNNDPKYSKPIQLSASGANTYVWFPYNPIHMTYSLGPSTTVRPPATTEYTVTGASAVCSGTGIITVSVIPQFTMTVVPPLPAMCFGDSLKLEMVNPGPANLFAPPVSSLSYSWTAPTSQIMTGDNTSALTQSIAVYPLTTTTYSAEIRDTRSCVSLPKLVTVTVLPRPITAISIPTINNVPTNTVCFVGLNPGPSDVVLDLTGVNKNTNLQFGVVPTYTWISPYDKYNSILTPVNLPKVTVSAPVKAPSVVVYTLVSGYNGVPGCRREDTVSVRVIDCRPVTAVTFTTADKVDTICSRRCITFINTTDTAAGGPQTFTWTFPGGNPNTSTSSVVTVCYNLPNTYNVFLTVGNQYPLNPPNGAPPGSKKTYGVQSFVKVVDIPNVTIIAPGQLRSDTIIRFGQEVKLRGTGATTYSWFPPYNITSLSDPFVTVNPIKTTQYILTGKNSRECYSSDTLNVIVIEDCGEMYVPNAFSPNGDGHNDELKVNGICLESLTFMVFNRWGEKVFETTDQKIGWDGTYKGEALNTAIFVYRLEGKTYEGKAFSSKGNITLMR